VQGKRVGGSVASALPKRAASEATERPPRRPVFLT
jgi:hypothetical protein